MEINIYEEIKRAFKDALTEWWKENYKLTQNIHSQQEDGNSLLTVRQFCEKHPFITESGMRHKLNYREWNGIDKCISKGIRRVLIKEKEMLDWFHNPPLNANWTYDENKYKKY